MPLPTNARYSACAMQIGTGEHRQPMYNVKHGSAEAAFSVPDECDVCGVVSRAKTYNRTVHSRIHVAIFLQVEP